MNQESTECCEWLWMSTIVITSMEAGGPRECVADLLPYAVHCSERE